MRTVVQILRLIVVAGVLTLGWTALLGAGAADDVPEVIVLPENPQELGDPAKGHEYLLYGDYIGAGIPESLFRAMTPSVPEDERVLERDGPSADIPHPFNRFEMDSGAVVIAGINCMGCHAQVFEGELVMGLGNSLSDFTSSFAAAPVRELASMLYAEGSPELVALHQILRGGEALESATTPFRGVNPAFRYEELAAAHRDPETLAWTEERVFEPNADFVASDVPAWWNVKKKHALYYLGLGRGDFVRAIQQITVVAIEDKDDAARIAEGMRDLLAYIFELEAPRYADFSPVPIDLDLAREGAEVFAANCAECHGEYDETFLDGPGVDWPGGRTRETYPNKLVSLGEVGTDPVYAEKLLESGLWEWFNESWYAQTAPDTPGGVATYATPEAGYVAPPLDGVWMTAPYFHNGSVPTLEGVVDSGKRPTFWRRSFRDDDYDYEGVGWNFTVEDGPVDKQTYDTTVPGYGNGGHGYGDALSGRERRAVVEYLKGL